jgi:HEPN domain-containing protein
MLDANPDTVLDALTRAVVERFAPERIVLFGSRARGDHRPDSDYDLMVVLDQPPDPSDVIARTVRDVVGNADVLVDSSQRFEHRRTDVGTLEYAIEQEGRVLYMRSPARNQRQVRERPSEPPESLQEWIARARSDFTAMEQLIVADATDINDAIVFHAHQAGEKMLKAALVARNVPPPRTHELMELLDRLGDELRMSQDLREACADLDALWASSRYPHNPFPTDAEVRRAVEAARRLRRAVRTGMGDA